MVKNNCRCQFRFRFIEARKKNSIGGHGFAVLGPEAKDAVPNLIQILDQNVSATSQMFTADALGSIGPAAKSATRSLLNVVGGTNDVLRGSACHALGQIHSQPDLVVPVLINCLGEASLFVRRPAAAALGSFGKDAILAVPALVESLKDQDEGVRKSAENSLKKIDSEAARKAQVR